MPWLARHIGPDARLWVGAASALVLHAALGAVLSRAPAPSLSPRRPQVVELDVREPAPPPPPPEAPPPEPVTPPPLPVVVRRIPRKVKPPPEDTPPPPPPPNRTPPPEAPPAAPAFGVTPDSVAAGPSDVAVPVGNTLMTAERASKPAGPLGPPPPGVVGGTGTTPSFAPVPDSYLAELSQVTHEELVDYPLEARRMEVEGVVVLRVGIDHTGVVREVKVLRGLGHGLDEAASKALWRFKFRPARANDGRAVDSRITYNYRFTLPH